MLRVPLGAFSLRGQTGCCTTYELSSVIPLHFALRANEQIGDSKTISPGPQMNVIEALLRSKDGEYVTPLPLRRLPIEVRHDIHVIGRSRLAVERACKRASDHVGNAQSLEVPAGDHRNRKRVRQRIRGHFALPVAVHALDEIVSKA